MGETRWALVGGSLLCAVAAAKCSTDASAEASKRGSEPGDFADAAAGDGSAASAGSVGASGAGGSGGVPPPPPEVEKEAAYRSPVATGRFVWTANPLSGRVAFVDAETLDVTTVEAGFAPTYLAAVPSAEGTDRVIVVNALGDDATVLTVGTAGILEATVSLHRGANAWAVSPSGRWAIAWTDGFALPSPDPTEGFQDVTVVDLAGKAPVGVRLSVGYRPVTIQFASDEGRAFAITEPGVSVIELDPDVGARVIGDIALTKDAIDDPSTRDVSITPDGSLALVRRTNRAEVNFVSLSDGALVERVMPGFVTDLDISADGATAYAVSRFGDASFMSVLPLPGVVMDAALVRSELVPDEIFGSVAIAPDGVTALVFTNAVANDHLTIVDTSTEFASRTVDLKAPVDAVFVAPDSEHAIALLAPDAGLKLGAFSTIPIKGSLPPKIQGTDAEPFAVAIAPDGRRAVVVTRNDVAGFQEAFLVRMPELRVDRLALSSPPLAAGVVPGAGRAYIAQAHPEGRVTFIDLETGLARTLTGFELDSKVVDGAD